MASERMPWPSEARAEYNTILNALDKIDFELNELRDEALSGEKNYRLFEPTLPVIRALALVIMTKCQTYIDKVPNKKKVPKWVFNAIRSAEKYAEYIVNTLLEAEEEYNSSSTNWVTMGVYIAVCLEASAEIQLAMSGGPKPEGDETIHDFADKCIQDWEDE